MAESRASSEGRVTGCSLFNRPLPTTGVRADVEGVGMVGLRMMRDGMETLSNWKEPLVRPWTTSESKSEFVSDGERKLFLHLFLLFLEFSYLTREPMYIGMSMSYMINYPP